MRALLLGSIGTLAETSDIQRQAFNAAFAVHGLDWHWSRERYALLLLSAGGRDRIAAEAEARGVEVDVAALHRRKSELFQARVREEGLSLRPGLAEALARAEAENLPVALVTTTGRANVEAVLAGLGLPTRRFALIADATQVRARKPAPEVYEMALRTLGVAARDALAVEDNPDGAAAALAAGIACIALPGALHRPETFPAAAERQAVLDLSERFGGAAYGAAALSTADQSTAS